MTFPNNSSCNLSEQLISELEVDINEDKPVAMEMMDQQPDLYWQRINHSTPLMMVFPDQMEMLPAGFHIESDLNGPSSSYFYLNPIQDAWESVQYWPNADNLYQYIHQIREAMDNQI